jgi:phosphohistidine phosphatase
MSPVETSRPHRLVLLRHAKSSWVDDQPDAERPLSDRGRKDAAAAGRWLVEEVGTVDLVLCSTAVRTRETWDRAARSAGGALADAPVRYEPAIYEAWPDTLLELVRALPETVGTVLLVGHGPGLPDLAGRLNQLNGTEPLDHFPTSTVVVFEVQSPWPATGADTAWLTARAVPRG